ncbi:MAG: hypothetical protein OEQ18_03395 [Gammaproteobacteria bacterium]|nr:hypothetical protein [Gammaproteobacteria bacterium]
MATAKTHSVTVSKEMSISHREFFRTLPRVLADKRYRRNGTTVEVADGARNLTITLAPEAKRQVGAIELPSTRVEFLFDGHTAPEVRAFIAEFDLHFRRGGG